MSTYKLVCPCCNSSMRIRTSEGQTPCFRSMYSECNNLLCGATFSGSLVWEYQLSPSGIDRPLTVLPMAPTKVRLLARRNLATNTTQPDLLDQLEMERA
ncbi:Ogr/Delta-like zinc finger [Pseudomonas antarctica]|uniref:Ogr/delta-like Zinc finger n=1 Tax=Pseudomonas antarctica TaxID=219572 RepID=A0A1G9YDU6_9PSED|nr:ogr/Delta-like zinc finger family protein [Pseudomonas antarctica]KAF2410492.1 Ogr/delta-like zinc finger [Pseudomonas antarctica]SDN06776.1 Ogr/Delta-like zinc finger [Pseudomonas antarctica]